ncbi:alpha-E domain-containing protein [Aquisalimonas sp.]|uniref:alpha-E domain-containing protein n=1 Tax=Aquisalimonas sp. TaxID=1872621 RepID=UPI0025BAE4E6|nr:alpha-E domain-containing protein [Aquisalimonas sp.]
MLSRVAERVYWMGRYLERAESMARLVNAHSNEVMDLPLNMRDSWRGLANITGASGAFAGHYKNYDERNVVKFLLADTFNPGSILTSVRAARENVRTTRELMPTEAWADMNRLYLYVHDHVQKSLARRHRFEFLHTVIFRCQQISGLLAGTMSHDSAYDFVRLGQSLERADMTTRIVDSAVAVLMPREDIAEDYANVLWVHVLKSLSGYQMYRQHIHPRVVGHDVVRFLLQDRLFPRSVDHNIAVAEACMQALPRNEATLRRVGRLQRRINEAEPRDMRMDDLHEYIDVLQTGIGDIHKQLTGTWFRLDPDALPQEA